jgi:HAD superfamily hydrolase (TIGR01509 family)
LKRGPEPVRAVLFDLDGVLIESQRYWFHLFNQTLVHFGHRALSWCVFQRHWGQSTAEDIRIFMPERTLPEVREYFTRHRHDHAEHIRVHPRASTVLTAIRSAGVKLACVTNSHRAIALTQLTGAGLRRFFPVLITADDVVRPKPAPDMLRSACQRLGVRPGQALFIGDTRTDEQAARHAACRFIGCRYQSRTSIRDLSRLLSFFDKGFAGLTVTGF